MNWTSAATHSAKFDRVQFSACSQATSRHRSLESSPHTWSLVDAHSSITVCWPRTMNMPKQMRRTSETIGLKHSHLLILSPTSCSVSLVTQVRTSWSAIFERLVMAPKHSTLRRPAAAEAPDRTYSGRNACTPFDVDVNRSLIRERYISERPPHQETTCSSRLLGRAFVFVDVEHNAPSLISQQ